MSTNVGDSGPGMGRHYTVAELVARERAAARAAQRRRPAELTQPAQPTQRIEPVRPQVADTASTQSLHVTELLRREGVDYGEDTTEAPPALVAQPRDDKRAGNSRIAVLSKAAVLVGLTVGGLVGLQSTLATSPDDARIAARAGGSAGAPQAIDPSSSTSTIERDGGGATTTTSAEVELKDNATALDPHTPQQNAPSQESTGSGTGASAPTTTAAPAPTSDAQQQQQRNLGPEQSTGESERSQQDRSQQQDGSQQSSEHTEPSQPSQEPSGDDGGLLGEVLDPVTGTVSGVLDTGTDLLGL